MTLHCQNCCALQENRDIYFTSAVGFRTGIRCGKREVVFKMQKMGQNAAKCAALQKIVLNYI